VLWHDVCPIACAQCGWLFVLEWLGAKTALEGAEALLLSALMLWHVDVHAWW